jgi:hypothetical protein
MPLATRFSPSKAPIVEMKRAVPTLAAPSRQAPAVYRPVSASAGPAVAQLSPASRTNILPGTPPVYHPQSATLTAPPVYRPETKQSMQPKLALTQRSASPAMPSVYRPQSANLTAPPVYRPELKKSMQPKLAPATRPASSALPPIHRTVMPPPGHVHALSKVVQPYTKVKGKKGQGGFFIRGNAEIHLHIDIGIKSHLKIEGKTVNIGKKGAVLDATKIQGALNQLLGFKESIKNDTVRANNYAGPIQDCVDWLVENGAKLPLVATSSATEVKEEKKEGEKVETTPTATGYGDFFSNMSSSPISEDSFM